MGQTSSSTNNKHSVYGKKEYSTHVVSQLIKAQRLAPFHKPSDAHPVECPICFLNYPKDINYSTCCAQPICSDCFTQIKHKQDLCCPFCALDGFSVVYASFNTPYFETPPNVNHLDLSLVKECVKPSDIYPETKRKTDLRHMQQLTMYLGPTVAGRAETVSTDRQRALSEAAALTANAMENRNVHLLNAFRTMGADLEELMMMEAIRQSILIQQQNTTNVSNSENSASGHTISSSNNHLNMTTNDTDPSNIVSSSTAVNQELNSNPSSSLPNSKLTERQGS